MYTPFKAHEAVRPSFLANFISKYEFEHIERPNFILFI